jgi:exosortase
MSTARTSWSDWATVARSRGGVVAAAACAAAAAAYGPLLVPYFQNLWSREYYQHFPFVLAAFAALIAQRVAAAQPRPADFARRGLYGAAGAALAGLAWATLAAAYWLNSPWLAYASLIAVAGAALAWASSAWRIDGAAGVWLLLWLIVPPPLNRDGQLVAALQRFSSRASSFVLDFVGVPHLMEGNTLALAEKQLFVDEACSGIISVMAIIACAAIYGVWRRRPAVHVVALMLAGIGWATIMNTVRISTIAITLHFWGIDWSKGTPHEVLSLVVFLLAFGALVSTDVLLEGVFAPIGAAWEHQRGGGVAWGASLVHLWDLAVGLEHEDAEGDAAPDDEPGARRPVARAAWRLRWAPVAALIAAFAALPVWGLTRAHAPTVFAEAMATDQAQASVARARAIDGAFLPEQVGDLVRVKYFGVERTRDDLMGNFSRCHEYQDAKGRTYLVSCDFPYEGGWHELTLCYQGIGWELTDRRVETVDAGAGRGPWDRMEASFSKISGARAFVTVCGFDEHGQPIAIPTQSLWADAWNVLTSTRDLRPYQVAFQTQVFTTAADAEIDDAQRAAARELMLAAREKFYELVAPPADAARPARSQGANRDSGVAPP